MITRSTARRAGAIALIAALAVSIAPGAGAGDNAAAPSAAAAQEKTVLRFTLNRIDGTPQDLASYKGSVVLIVNTASACGLTPQYQALQSLYDAKKDKGLVVLGFPANNFGAQEPGTNEQIQAFCTGTFGVSFPMFEKISVKGDDVHPLYATLAALPAPLGGEPKWNFTKFLVDRSGQVVARYEPKTAPDDPALLAQLDALLAQAP